MATLTTCTRRVAMSVPHRSLGARALLLALALGLPLAPGSGAIRPRVRAAEASGPALADGAALVPPAIVRGIRVLPEAAPDCTSLDAIVRSVTRGCRTNDEKAIALYNFLNLALYHFAYPSEPRGISALKLINAYGWSLCGGEHTVEAALWKAAGWKWRYVGWSDPGHTTVEAEYDGAWHYLDVFLRFWTWRPDAAAPGGRTIASQADIRATPELLTEGFWLDPARGVCYRTEDRFEILGEKANWTAPAFLVCGDDIPGILRGVSHSSPAGSPEGWNAIVFDDPEYSAEVDLAPGSSLTLLWDPIEGGSWFGGRDRVPGHTCGDKDYRNCPAIGPVLEPYRSEGSYRRTFGSGRLVLAPDLGREECLRSFAAVENARVAGGAVAPADPARPGSVVALLASPYVLTRCRVAGDGIDRVEVSADRGKTWTAAGPDVLDDAVGGRYAVLVRVAFRGPLRGLRIEATVQANPTVLPYLSPGRNRVLVSVADPARLGGNRLAVTYAYRVGSRRSSWEQLCDADKEIARAHDATWSKEATVVRKVFAAGDLPAAFDVDVPTPRGAYPVYPRMVFVRREVLPPGAEPAALPERAIEPRREPGDSLASLPNPFAMGIAKPPPRVARPTTTRRIELVQGPIVGPGGAVSEGRVLRWPKAAGENVVPQALLVGGALGDLPRAADIAAARLVVPVAAGHEKAPGQLGATLLAEPFEAGKPFPLEKLGDVVGVSVVPKQPADTPRWAPPLEVSVDVRKALKRVAAGEAKFQGFGLRIVPSRPVDDGWTVRAEIPPDAKIALEVDVYAR